MALFNSIAEPFEAWVHFFCTSTAILTLGALGVAGLLIPDSWLDERMRQKMKYLLIESVRHTGKKDEASWQPPAVNTLILPAVASDRKEREESVEDEQNTKMYSTVTENAAVSEAYEGEDKEKKQMNFCPWCGGRSTSGEECCEYGAMMAVNDPNSKASYEKAADIQGKKSMDGEEDLSPSELRHMEQKPPILRFLDKVGASFKKKPQKASDKDDKSKLQRKVIIGKPGAEKSHASH